ncbi:MAG: SUMF1/EgtB/PvdO family nonheme iron enzyme [Myxococcales bacterium]|nr:SUMF1/EgtB/PvdO family nonheme iron enzyme [Myxococcales bacterium]
MSRISGGVRAALAVFAAVLALGACGADNTTQDQDGTATGDATGDGSGGPDVQLPCATACEHGGFCLDGVCDCTGTGYRGASCAEPVCTDPCLNGGTCTAPDTCSCATNYSGDACETPSCGAPCEHGGTCVAVGVCACEGTGYTGTHCETPVCTTPCQNGGFCAGPETCDCGDDAAYEGAACTVPICGATCKNGGACVAPDTCDCTGTGYTGDSCTVPICPGECLHGGVCSAPNTCDCDGTGYTGDRCQTPTCETPCQHGGTCTAANTCDCSATGWSGSLCQNPVCLSTCQNGGVCVGPETCDCAGTGYVGDVCERPLCGVLGVPCPDGFTCTGRGTCERGPTGEVFVPAGTFWMGCNSALDASCTGFATESPQHEVTLSGYFIDRTEVTAANYKLCVVAGQCTTPVTVNGAYATFEPLAKQQHPVNFVSFAQAQDYCAWTGKAAGAQRLCTEAEWERAARGGCETISGECRTGERRFPWGATAPTCSLANTSNGGYCYVTDNQWTAAVGATPAGASPYGALDMAGNVFEWVADWSGTYSADPVTDPTGPASGQHVARGGAFDQSDARASRRLFATSSQSLHNIGIRCCRDAE